MSDATASVLETMGGANVRGSSVKRCGRRAIKQCGRATGQCAREAGESDVPGPLVVCDVLHALRQCPLAPTLRWPDDDSDVWRRSSTRGRGSSSQRGQPSQRVRDALPLSALLCCVMVEAFFDGPNQLLHVLAARTALPVSVLAQYTTNHGPFADYSQANWHTAWHTTLV